MAGVLAHYRHRFVIAIAIVAEMDATGIGFSDFLIDGMAKSTKVDLYYSCASIAATGVGGGTHHL